MLKIYRAAFSDPFTGKTARPAEFLKAADDRQAWEAARRRAGELGVALWDGTRRVDDTPNEIRIATVAPHSRSHILRRRAQEIDEALRENTGPQWRAAKRLAQSYRDEALMLEREPKVEP
ncbi:hypothetical protein GJW-30_1_00567 [Variibacter gotjawalensis]|uniref:Uncharacterized protein n=1 Tax=Variibacter gotjawalensis TaxID=1333996 RepID=A0A0S3PQ35_9BRAD|nr:hypothetical protein [Variibacter gotjawalensis]NIK48352.1 hypothetical protein [Variibacter gotjawalensis]RZS50222.1 hypothetical protein EV661_2677 [Variibacter gotjawalensis]BAT58053.1 hypothetical protein GJW-30_1_00567 [Variibacter gotjawalensis]